jgi:hypothetical protein
VEHKSLYLSVCAVKSCLNTRGFVGTKAMALDDLARDAVPAAVLGADDHYVIGCFSARICHAVSFRAVVVV